jgi:hypothetical protein
MDDQIASELKQTTLELKGIKEALARFVPKPVMTATANPPVSAPDSLPINVNELNLLYRVVNVIIATDCEDGKYVPYSLSTPLVTVDDAEIELTAVRKVSKENGTRYVDIKSYSEYREITYSVVKYQYEDENRYWTVGTVTLKLG